ncbi:DUF5655 domain-containing protein [Streptomyces xinghaiensis]|uniref:DUF5655 domain-containing protein n=1 Tax=Streptomyces xinghaiensis TaxID=1038928 RepID=UPI002E137315|nr:DUF5655 domain-containing protein [Streptomyces xinghaiensis]
MRGVEEFFGSDGLGLAVFERVRSLLEEPVEVRVSKSQVAFRRRRGFAYLWVPGRYLRAPAAEVVLSIVLGRHDPSPRFKEVSHPTSRHWIHHLEVHSLDEIDDEVAGWLVEAADRAT